MCYKHCSRVSFCVVVPAALVLVFLVSSCSPTTAPPTPTLQPIVNTQLPFQTQTQPVAFPVSGKWIGNAKNGSFEMQVVITLEAVCEVGQVCGTFDLQNIPCSGTFTLLGREKDVYEFRAGNKRGSCGVGRDFLQLLPGGKLQYTSKGDYGETFGILVRDNNLSSPAPSSQTLSVIYDDDGSPDGTTALLYLLSDFKVSLKGVSISYGEAHPQIYIQHMGRMLDKFGFIEIPLGAGQDGPLTPRNDFPEWLRQSSDNFWGFPLPNPQKEYPVQDSAQLMVAIINQSPEPVTIFISGPCTNLARALRLDPGIRDHIKAVYLMGGAIYTPGNLSDLIPNPTNTVAEWNVFVDPQAASEVFASGLHIYLVPLDATNQVKITVADTSQWRTGGDIANFAADIYDMLLKNTNKSDIAIWDLMTAEIMVKPELCGFQPLHLEVITEGGNTSGQTVVLPVGKANINVCLQPNVELIKQTLVDVFSRNR